MYAVVVILLQTTVTTNYCNPFHWFFLELVLTDICLLFHNVTRSLVFFLWNFLYKQLSMCFLFPTLIGIYFRWRPIPRRVKTSEMPSCTRRVSLSWTSTQRADSV